MLKMCRELGFEVKTDTEDRGLCDVTLTLENLSSSDSACVTGDLLVLLRGENQYPNDARFADGRDWSLAPRQGSRRPMTSLRRSPRAPRRRFRRCRR